MAGWSAKILILAVVTAAVAVNDSWRQVVVHGCRLLWERDYDSLRLFIAGYGHWAPLVSIAIMTVQSVVPF
ncbi:MAG: hypothetical protein N3A57_05460, partial [Negativicutes bacterium]|nr:hypothetical protein [Negativicutes bacterium]